MSGEIPRELGELSSLNTLSLYDNRLSGRIPTELGNLANLRELLLQVNRLEGSIPSELGNLRYLHTLLLGHNSLTGCIPTALRGVEHNDFSELGLLFCDGSAVEPPPSDPCVVDMGDFDTRLESIYDSWDGSCLSINRPRDGDYYARFFTFRLREEADVTITLESDEDAYLYLIEGEGERGPVLYEDDDTNGINSRIRTTLQPGTYTVEATTYEIGVEGNYTVSVETDELDGRPPVTCLNPIPRLPSGQYFDRTFHLGEDCKSVNRPAGGDYNASFFTLPLEFPADVSIWLRSEEDGYLYLLEGDDVIGDVLDEDDDTSGTDPVIKRSLMPGIYTIEATTYGEGVAGEFELEVLVSSKAGDLCLNGLALDGLDDQLLFNDCAMLLDIMYMLDAEPTLNWSADLPIGEWEGVTIAGSPNRVVRLSLSERGLKGQVPTELDYLWGLEHLDLSGNLLTGTTPDFRNSTNLEHLNLGSNRLGGEIRRIWSNPSELEVLYLYDNKLSGEIPVELSSLQRLKALGLDRNRLSGEIPAELGGLENLDKMHLADNRLVGMIPPELADIPDLYGLFISGNYLTGCIPDGLLDVEENDFDALGLPFCVPLDEAECIEPLPAVKAITIRDSWKEQCKSDGGDLLARYYTLSLDEPTLVGLGLTSGHGGYLFLRDGADRYGRVLGEQSDSKDIVYVVEMLPPGTYMIEASRDVTRHVEDFSLMVRLLEEIPSQSRQDISALMALYLATNGEDWKKAANWLTDAPLSEWHGVWAVEQGRVTDLRVADNNLGYRLPVEVGDLTELRVLHLEFNELVGEIPEELAKLSHLKELRISFNDLTGPIPAQLGELSDLEELQLNDNELSGEIPGELGNLGNARIVDLGHNELLGEIPPELGRLTKAVTLSLASNRISGEIPRELGLLINLRHLVLGHNRLGGEIPTELSNLKRLADLSMQANSLSGGIPPWLGDIAGLNVLNLRDNRLTGEIPAELGKLSNLEILDFGGSNRLSGEIPMELTGLTNLKVLHLYSNSLSGKIPRELANLSELRDLRLHRNYLTGEIPSDLGELSDLEILYLSFNELKGEIPAELGDLSELRILDLQYNQLTGEIPKSLAGLAHLGYADFRRNELMGCIPFGMRGIVETDPVLPVCAAP